MKAEDQLYNGSDIYIMSEALNLTNELMHMRACTIDAVIMCHSNNYLCVVMQKKKEIQTAV